MTVVSYAFIGDKVSGRSVSDKYTPLVLKLITPNLSDTKSISDSDSSDSIEYTYEIIKAKENNIYKYIN